MRAFGLLALLSIAACECRGQAELVFLPPDYASDAAVYDGFATAVSASGDVLTGYHQWLDSAGEYHDAVFAWSPSAGFQQLGLDAGQRYPLSAGISSDGNRVVGLWQVPYFQPFVWVRSGGDQLIFPSAMEGLWYNLLPTAISSNGQVVVGSGDKVFRLCDDITRSQAFIWHVDGSLAALDPADCTDGLPDESRANAVNDDGTVVVGSRLNRAFRWTASGGFTIIGPAGSDAISVSADGVKVLVSSALGLSVTDGGGSPVLVSDDPDLSAVISGDGNVVAGNGPKGGWVWTQNGGAVPLRDLLMTRYALDLRGWCLHPEAISFDGTVLVGHAVTASGQSGPFWLRLVAESQSGCLADFDWSGFVDTDDFDAFVEAFEQGARIADFDGNCFVDTDDFDSFVQAFEFGC